MKDDPEKIKLRASAIAHTAGLSPQSAAARFSKDRYRFGGRRLIDYPRVKPMYEQDTLGSTLTNKERRYRGQR